MSNFVQQQAEAYRDAPVRIAPWNYYVKEVVTQWREIDHPIVLVDSALSYLDASELRADIEGSIPMKVWKGGTFDEWHPLNGQYKTGSGLLLGYQISRALHDYRAHNEMRFGFSPLDELGAAYRTRVDFSILAQRAQWTDDVAMGCYYAHFGKWPEIQRPIIVEPDWQGLKEYLG